MTGINTTKLLVLAILGFCAMVLGSAVLTLQIYVAQERQRLGLTTTTMATRRGSGSKNKKLVTTSSLSSSSSSSLEDNQESSTAAITTIKPLKPVSSKDKALQNQKFSPPQGQQGRLSQQAYWKQALPALQAWDVLLVGDNDDDNENTYDLTKTTATQSKLFLTPEQQLFALQQASNEGDPRAQYYMANAYASGIWPLPRISSHSTNDERTLQVLEDWYQHAENDEEQEGASTTTKNLQFQHALILWHMAAVGGHVDAALAMVSRLRAKQDEHNHDDYHTNTNSNNTTCPQVLPYLEAAAHGLMDVMEAYPHSRAQVLPPLDRHYLAQVYMHGGTASQLDAHNKPYESKEAIQFYHIKATSPAWKAPRMTTSTGDDDKKKNANKADKTTTADVDLNAAYTLALYYHYGEKGVPQNLTSALRYYQIAADHGHWESAGVVGTFYLWGMGTPQNIGQAHHYFKLGAPGLLDGCRRRHEQTLSRKKNKKKDKISECDAASLNGLGILHLVGVKKGDVMLMSRDLAQAERYFGLAKELGNVDAMYHLAMMWLGWKTHFKHVEDLKDDGVSHDPSNSNLQQQGATAKKNTATFALHYSPRTDSLSKGPLQGDIQDAMQLLIAASKKDHIQAKHRLAMMYSQGVSIQTSTLQYDAVKPNCAKAMELYQWIVDYANIPRSKRLRAAYQAYVDGDWEVSLRNYLAAAETGSTIGQVNAAFLLEQRTCLGLTSMDCAKASVRLWKAAANVGTHPEAFLRVGDFYYYGRLRDHHNDHGNTTSTTTFTPVGPFGWTQYLLFPEKYLPQLLSKWWVACRSWIERVISGGETSTILLSSDNAGSEDSSFSTKESQEADLAMAAHYYSEAAEKHKSARANFNLGFMYEFGLGLKQDFPLAKRHYDLAATLSRNGEANLAVQMSLWAMSIHEVFVKVQLAWQIRQVSSMVDPDAQEAGISRPNNAQSKAAGHAHMTGRTQQDVIVSHLFNWSSLLILILLLIVMELQKIRERRQAAAATAAATAGTT